jgi:hypothetical protein
MWISGVAYSANSLTFSMAKDVRLWCEGFVLFGSRGCRVQLTVVGEYRETSRSECPKAPKYGEQSGLAEKADKG